MHSRGAFQVAGGEFSWGPGADQLSINNYVTAESGCLASFGGGGGGCRGSRPWPHGVVSRRSKITHTVRLTTGRRNVYRRRRLVSDIEQGLCLGPCCRSIFVTDRSLTTCRVDVESVRLCLCLCLSVLGISAPTTPNTTCPPGLASLSSTCKWEADRRLR